MGFFTAVVSELLGPGLISSPDGSEENPRRLSTMALNVAPVRDTKWLTLEVCRQFQRGTCSRSDEECKFAHPPKSCQVENGRVIACFDSLKVRACVSRGTSMARWIFRRHVFRGTRTGVPQSFLGSVFLFVVTIGRFSPTVFFISGIHKFFTDPCLN